jgi:hypothetical protein
MHRFQGGRSVAANGGRVFEGSLADLVTVSARFLLSRTLLDERAGVRSPPASVAGVAG